MAAPSTMDFTIDGMSCAACARRLERVLNNLDHVEASVNFAASQAQIRAQKGKSLPKIEVIVKAIKDAGFEGQPSQQIRQEDIQKRFSDHYHGVVRDFLIALFCTLPLMLMMLPGLHHILPRWSQFLLASIVQFWCARRFYRQAWASLRNKAANMDVLVVLGTLTAYISSALIMFLGSSQSIYFDTSTMIITLILLGRLLEMRARHQAGAGIESLLKLQPRIAHKEYNNEVIECSIDDLRVGDHLIVRPGEAIPVDGIILSGESEIDESFLTGEAFPVLRKKDDKIYAATLNGNGILRFRATEIGAQTTLSRITRLVEQAQGSKANIQRLADRVSAIFVPVVLAIALITFIGNWILLSSLSHALIRTVSVLVVACPCALGLATPAALMVGTARGARAGILFRDAQALERSRHITTMVFDKTGTLTQGKPSLTDIVTIDGSDKETILSLSYALEKDSEHPFAEAVRHDVKEKNISPVELDKVQAVPGKGIKALSKAGETILLGTPLFLSEHNIELPEKDFKKLEEKAQSVVILAKNSKAIGFLCFEDELRPESHYVIETLLKSHIEPVILTGDQDIVARSVAQKLGIEKVFASILPDQKAREITRLRDENHIVAMVGDGINDAPALAAAHLSFAMGSGAAAALESADIVLVKNGLNTLLDALSLSKATLSRIKQNLFFAFIYNVLSLPLAAFGYLTPVLAASLMALSSVSVVCNALWLNRWSPLSERSE
ncbi:heavy metal translocating P-type ATPase [Aristophania vespae]|uniref:Heavy metal translocating P-type ATPase n=1 Tax=Aristophania vespae TaxID=2697033 RepID=A0A6P1NH28_9PROT|nr:heavy metal translocating P-type ATPase [Aristophania vespae]QHI96187.1 heavy metal translocating P-type ATPase [Aristophania vespae]